MTATPTSTASTAPSAPSGRESFFNFAKTAGAVSGAIAAGALVLNNISNVIIPRDIGAGVSDASNLKVAASSVILGTAGTMAWGGSEALADDFGRKPGTTAIGVGLAGTAGFAVGNMFTGGWLEKGSLGMAAVGAGAAGAAAVARVITDRRAAAVAGGTPATGGGRVRRTWDAVTNRLGSRGAKAAVAGLGTLAITETSNALNWPFGGFNHVGAAVGATIAGLTVGGFGYAKERYDDLDDSQKRRTKIVGGLLGAVALVGGAIALRHGVFGFNPKGGHEDKIAPRGNGSSTATTLAPTTTGGNTSTTTTVLSTTTAPSGTTANTVATTAAPAVPVPGNGGGAQFTLQTFSAANKPAMVEQITGMGIPAPKANTIADQILTGQYKGVTENPEAFQKFVSGDNQAFADWAFQKDVVALAG